MRHGVREWGPMFTLQEMTSLCVPLTFISPPPYTCQRPAGGLLWKHTSRKSADGAVARWLKALQLSTEHRKKKGVLCLSTCCASTSISVVCVSSLTKKTSIKFNYEFGVRTIAAQRTPRRTDYRCVTTLCSSPQYQLFVLLVTNHSSSASALCCPKTVDLVSSLPPGHPCSEMS